MTIGHGHGLEESRNVWSRSQVTVVGRWSLVVGLWSFVIGRWSLVVGFLNVGFWSLVVEL